MVMYTIIVTYKENGGHRTVTKPWSGPFETFEEAENKSEYVKALVSGASYYLSVDIIKNEDLNFELHHWPDTTFYMHQKEKQK